ncbi:MAG: NAD-dependent epimerase/dehydratase family protein [Ignavibacteriales bacterium]|nr:NAD-dependent epimerase/dehydratase family protein [Ignavibacteriales bacterium]
MTIFRAGAGIMNDDNEGETMAVLAITGASGYLGQGLLGRLRGERLFHRVIGLDIRPPVPTEGMEFIKMDVRDPGLSNVFKKESVSHVVHLAFVVNPTHNPRLEHDVDVGGTRNVLQACETAPVRKLVIASSIAAYGWHADNPLPIPESHPLRGNGDFHYSMNKAIVEGLITDFSSTHPGCNVVVLRICNVLGRHVHNAISAGLEAPMILGIRRRDPFLAFTHEEDMNEILFQSLVKPVRGAFNVAGEGMVRLSEMARIARRKFVRFPEYLARALLNGLFALRLAPFGGGQLGFVTHSCVPDITKLKREFGYIPRFSSRETFCEFVEERILR